MDRIYKSDEEKLDYISVTTALSVLDKPGLYKWYGSNGTDACQKILEESVEFGKTIHSKIEMSLKSGKPINVADAPQGQRLVLAKFNQWKEEVGFECIASELTCYSETYLYAGTLDVFGMVNGEPMFLDFKTGNHIYDTVAYQLSAVKRAYEETYPQDRRAEMAGRAVLHLNRKDPMYKFKVFDEGNKFQSDEICFSAFLSCLNLYKIRRKLNLDIGVTPNEVQFISGALSDHERQEAAAAV